MSTPKIVKQDPNSKDSSENNGRRKKGGFGSNSKDCQQFVTIGAVLGCALVASSLMMCFLSARLMRLTKQYKREKLGIVKPKNLPFIQLTTYIIFHKFSEGVVREHRMKFGTQPGLFVSTPHSSKFMAQR